LFGGKEKYKLTVERDNIKKKFCEDEHIPLLVVRYDDRDPVNTLSAWLSNIEQVL